MCATQSRTFGSFRQAAGFPVRRNPDLLSIANPLHTPLLQERTSLTFSKSARLIRSSDFRQAYTSGLRLSCRFFAAFCFYRQESPAAAARIGFTLPRALGCAVVRNRIKRRMKEAVRLELFRLPQSWNIVFNPRRSVLDAAFDDLRQEVGRVFDRCNK